MSVKKTPLKKGLPKTAMRLAAIASLIAAALTPSHNAKAQTLTGTVTVNSGQTASYGETYVEGQVFDNGTVNSGEVQDGIYTTGAVVLNSGTWTDPDGFYIGNVGNGSLTLEGNSVLNTNTALVETYFGNGVANISGGVWTNADQFVIGNTGMTGYSGILTITGGTLTNQSGAFTVGSNGPGTMTVAGGIVNSGGTVSVAVSAGINGTVNIGNGSTAGILNALIVSAGAGNAVLNFNQSGSISFNPQITGNMTVNNIAGTTVLTGSNPYTGPTTISGGILKLGMNGSIANSSVVSIAAGGVFDTTSQSTFAMLATQQFTFTLNPANGGAAGLINAAGLDITNANVNFSPGGDLAGQTYVIADYTSLVGTQFASVTGLENGYTIDYAYDNGTEIAAEAVPEPTTSGMLVGAFGTMLWFRRRV